MCENAEQVRTDEVLACSFERWYDKFRDVTFTSRVIVLPEDFVKYLMADGIQMPGGLGENTAANNGEDSDSEWGDGGSDSADNQTETENPSFPEVENAVRSAIADLEGAVLPKLNWSAPKDAKWMNFGTLKCGTVQEVFTLLKASDFIAHDLCHSLDDCTDASERPSRPDVFCLVLREWRSIDEASEFRCFVSGGRLRGVSQRHTSLFWEHLVDPAFTDGVVAKIAIFFEERVKGKFPLDRFVFDVLVCKAPRHKVRLVDFSPWISSTDPLLFDWRELPTLGADDGAMRPEFRCVRSEAERCGKVENYHSVPLEVAELGSATPNEMEDLCRRAERNIGR